LEPDDCITDSLKLAYLSNGTVLSLNTECNSSEVSKKLFMWNIASTNVMH